MEKKLIELSENCRKWEKPSPNLEFKKAVIDSYPYVHVDLWFFNQRDIYRKFIFGIPHNKEKGLAFYVLKEDKTFLANASRPDFSKEVKCYFHEDIDMVLTKDFDFATPRRFQFKCPECFLTKTVKYSKLKEDE